MYRGWVPTPRRDLVPKLRPSESTRDTHTCGQTDTCENISFLQLLWRAVIMFLHLNYYRPQWSWSKVISSQASVILFGGSASVHAEMPPSPWQGSPPPPGKETLPWQGRPPLRSACWEIQSTSGRYASYWNVILVSLHIRSMWETICDAQAGFCTHSSNSKFVSKFSRKPLCGISDQKAPPPPISENFRFEMTKVYSEILPSPRQSGRSYVETNL